LSGMREIAQIHKGDFRLTPNQNVVIANVESGQKTAIDNLVADYGLDTYKKFSRLRLHSMACVALPTCGQAMAEAERYLPDLLKKIEKLLESHQLQDQAITLRMTGCPNGCARPYLAEIGLVGKAPGRFNLHLGAAFDGTRLNRMMTENADETTILTILNELFEDYSANRESGERFGDYFVRSHHEPVSREDQNV
jgi:sulfite reductase (NADPH) hemoprotein beta-component